MNPQSAKQFKLLATIIGALVIAAGAWLCWLVPERRWAWLLAMCAMPLAWAVQGLLSRAELHCPNVAEQNQLTKALGGAGLIMLVSMLAVIGQQLNWFNAEPGELSQRAWGVIMGAMVVVYANVIPKQPGSANRQSLLRFCGWALVIGGLSYGALWLAAPLSLANSASMSILALATTLVALRVLWSYLKNSGGGTGTPRAG